MLLMGSWEPGEAGKSVTAHLEDFGLGVDDYGVDAPLDTTPAADTTPNDGHTPETHDLEPRPRLAGPARYGLIFLIGVLVVGLVGGSFVALFDSPSPEAGADVVDEPAAAAPVEAGPAEASDVAPPATGDDITAVTWQGYSMPVSPTAGPQTLTATRATGFARTEVGAALAALHISVRMAPMTGPKVYRPAITDQVVGQDTSKQLAAVDAEYQRLARVAGVSDGAPVVGATPPFTGYRVRDYTATTATVDLVVTNPYEDRDLQYSIPVRWTRGDWRIVFAPADTGGGWFTVTKPNPSTTYEPFTKGPQQ